MARSSVTAWISLLLAGCLWIGPGAEQDRMDLDGDGVRRPEDCDDQDAGVGTAATWYLDGDGDGHGRDAEAVTACDAPQDAVETSDDCDDRDAVVHPGAEEACNGEDDDCDGTPDDGIAIPTWYADGDEDGFGDPTADSTACEAPSGSVDNGLDCDDTDPDAHPGAMWYPDVDLDAHGDGDAGVASCLPLAPTDLPTGDDCDDGNAGIHPGVPEICDELDQDCDTAIDEEATDAPSWYADADGDGFGDKFGSATRSCTRPSDSSSDDADCADDDDQRHPLALERCNGWDDDCDGAVDDDDPSLVAPPVWYLDGDLDGFGVTTVVASSCLAPAGYAALPGDCDDGVSVVNPEAPELCDGVDDDCDGLVDDADPDRDPGGTTPFFLDTDEDGFGDPSVQSAAACVAPDGYVADDTDCDDLDWLVHPGAPELCDNVDGDCDGTVDDNVQVVAWFVDADGDHWGVTTSTVSSCARQPGSVPFPGDCADNQPTVHPGAVERCNGVDDDCDVQIDDADPDVRAPAWHIDADHDGFGGSLSVTACLQPGSTVANDDDCADALPLVNPAALEVCDELDNDCDGLIDDGDPTLFGAPTWSADVDLDGFGDPAVQVQACDPPGGSVGPSNDCDDDDPEVHPGAVEVCNGQVDDDCDGLRDDFDPTLDRTTATTWYLDLDGDAFGRDASVPTCVAPPEFVADGGDCDESDLTVHPGAPELCDGQDNDCDGSTDEELPSWYTDLDGDGHGSGAAVVQCNPPQDGVSAGDDCDDADPYRFPGQVESCDGVDDDCDALVDNADPDLQAPTWYLDVDGDDFGAPYVTRTRCTAPPGYVASAGDCDDLRAQAYPGADEVCNLLDDDCDGLVDASDASVTDAEVVHPDADLDGYGDASQPLTTCFPPAGTVVDGTDCNDADFKVHPEGLEWCDGRDDDCDTLVDAEDPDVLDALVWFDDVDGDGFGDGAAPTLSCDAVPGSSVVGGDCDDTSVLVWPGAVEVCDGVDNDCDHNVDDGAVVAPWYADVDLDGFGDPADAVDSCTPLAGRVTNASDCDDGDGAVRPGATEVCNDVDDDCDGRLDDQDPGLTGAPVWYADADLDTYGSDTTTTQACVQPSYFAAVDGDCDDSNASVSPAGTEIPGNSLDEDCNGQIQCWRDTDQDGWGRAPAVPDNGDGLCLSSSREGQIGGDCADNDPAAHPFAPEVCNGIDDDCDVDVDEGCGGTGDTGVPALCPGEPLPTGDWDVDGVGDRCDDCPLHPDPIQVDSDADGLGDACDGALPGDTDGDGLRNGTESQLGTLSQVWDTDQDGLGDGFEVEISGGNPLLPDTDNGGATDLEEWLGGCDPTNGGDDGGC